MTTLGDLVRTMNCYYSNLIEGHDTHPIDIECAMKNDYSANAEQRNLQLEAKAHVTAQQWIDEVGLRGCAESPDSICDIHKHFGDLLPPEHLKVEDADTGETMEVFPGSLRQCDMKVGRHINSFTVGFTGLHGSSRVFTGLHGSSRVGPTQLNDI